MKKFIISVLCVSVFFIGLGSLIEQAGAKFNSDEKALALIAKARQAIGGDANIKNVRSMTIIGNTTHTFVTDGFTRTEPGSFEINFELPGKFNKMVRIGSKTDNAAGNDDVHKQVDVIIMKNEDKAEWKTNDDGKKVIVRKSDGTTETSSPDGNKIIVRKVDGDEGKKAVFESKDGKTVNVEAEKIVIEKEGPSSFKAGHQNEMFRIVFALLLSAPEGTDAGFRYGGESNVDGFPVEVVEVQSAGSTFKLYLDKTSHLPRMLSYMGMPVQVIKMKKGSPENAAKEEVKVFEHKMKKESANLVEHQVKFSDFRYVGGLQLPHRWTQTLGGNPSETIEITNYDINPANIAEKFQNQKVFIRQAKPKQ